MSLPHQYETNATADTSSPQKKKIFSTLLLGGTIYILKKNIYYLMIILVGLQILNNGQSNNRTGYITDLVGTTMTLKHHFWFNSELQYLNGSTVESSKITFSEKYYCFSSFARVYGHSTNFVGAVELKYYFLEGTTIYYCLRDNYIYYCLTGFARVYGHSTNFVGAVEISENSECYVLRQILLSSLREGFKMDSDNSANTLVADGDPSSLKERYTTVDFDDSANTLATDDPADGADVP